MFCTMIHYPLLDDETLTLAAKQMLRQMKSKDIRVRILCAQSIGSLFEIISDQTGFFKQVKKTIPLFQTGQKITSPEIQSSLVALASIGSVSPQNEREIIYDIFSFGLAQEYELVSNIISEIATKLNYPNPVALMEYHLEDFFQKWIQDNKGMNIFPYILFGKTDLSEFLSHYSSRLVPRLIFMKDSNTLHKISKILNTNLTEIFK